jgi:hypothetical protein
MEGNIMSTKLRNRVNADGTKLELIDALGNVVFAFALGTVHADLEARIRVYGITQILSDAGAASAGSSLASRVAAMSERARALAEGTWGQRRMIGENVFLALVALGLIARDTPDNRAVWRELSEKKRSTLAMHPKVVEWLAANAPKQDDDAAEEALALFA